MLGRKWKKDLSEEERQDWYLKSDEEKAKHKLKYPDYVYKPRRRQQKKKTVQYVELVIYTVDTATPAPPASSFLPALFGSSAPLAPLASSVPPPSLAPPAPAASLAPPVSSWLSLYTNTKTITDDVLNMNDIKLFQRDDDLSISSDVLDLDSLDNIERLLSGERIALDL